MDKAEEFAKKYCEGSSFKDACMEKPAYIAGYHQAEKDLELTWEDIKLIIDIVDSENLKPHLFDEIDYQEVLNRFSKQKERCRAPSRRPASE